MEAWARVLIKSMACAEMTAAMLLELSLINYDPRRVSAESPLMLGLVGKQNILTLFKELSPSVGRLPATLYGLS